VFLDEILRRVDCMADRILCNIDSVDCLFRDARCNPLNTLGD